MFDGRRRARPRTHFSFHSALPPLGEDTLSGSRLREIGVLRGIRGHGTSCTSSPSALQGNARTDRFCRSFHSSRPRATATLLPRDRVRARSCANRQLRVGACVRQSAAITAASTNHEARLISVLARPTLPARSLSRVIVRVRRHFIYDATSPLFHDRALLNLYPNLSNFPHRSRENSRGTETPKHRKL